MNEFQLPPNSWLPKFCGMFGHTGDRRITKKDNWNTNKECCRDCDLKFFVLRSK